MNANTSVGSASKSCRTALIGYGPMSGSGPAQFFAAVRLFSRDTCWQNTLLKMRGSPILPARTVSMASTVASSKCSR